MSNKEFPVTMWHANIAAKDGIAGASVGWLRALKAVDYKHVVLSPAGIVNMVGSPHYEAVREFMSYPAEYQNKLVTVKASDPRIGQYWGGTKIETETPPPPHAPAGTPSFKTDNKIIEGARDQDYYAANPEALTDKWVPKVECAVLHFDPGTLIEVRDKIAASSEGQLPIVGMTAWETNKLPAGVAQQLSDLDLLVVPSEHTMAAVRRGGCAAPIAVVPHALDIEPLTQEEYQLTLQSPSQRYTFYAIGTEIPRKNLRAVIAAYCRAFAPKYDGVGLIIKTTCDTSTAKKLYREGLEMAHVGGPAPKIAIYTDRWPAEKMRALHLNCNCLIDMTHGEGFGLVPLEAAAMGNPVITTGWGAQTEIFEDNPGTAYRFVDYVLEDIDPEMSKYGVYDEGQQWATPDLEHAVAIMRDLAVERWSKSLAQTRHIAATYGRETVGKHLAKMLEQAK